MAHGTATHRLRKLVLFRQLEKYGDNVFVRCNTVIGSVDDLSIEHLKPWEGISAELFWDLDNVAFSHVGCNRPHRIPGPKIFTPEGTNWCSRCQAALPVPEFQKCTAKDDGLQTYCKSCRTQMDKRPNHAKKV